MKAAHSIILLVCSVALIVSVGLQPAQAETLKKLKKLVQGTASWYGKKFHGKKTASGSIYDMNKLTCAHRTLPFGTKLRVYYGTTAKSCVVTVTDRGPYFGSRVIDLSKAAAHELGITGLGKVVCYQDGKQLIATGAQ